MISKWGFNLYWYNITHPLQRRNWYWGIRYRILLLTLPWLLRSATKSPIRKTNLLLTSKVKLFLWRRHLLIHYTFLRNTWLNNLTTKKAVMGRRTRQLMFAFSQPPRTTFTFFFCPWENEKIVSTLIIMFLTIMTFYLTPPTNVERPVT